eukprot:1475570-Rhodomonas_salina.1
MPSLPFLGRFDCRFLIKIRGLKDGQEMSSRNPVAVGVGVGSRLGREEFGLREKVCDRFVDGHCCHDEVVRGVGCGGKCGWRASYVEKRQDSTLWGYAGTGPLVS